MPPKLADDVVARIRTLEAQGMSRNGIARELKISRDAVRKYGDGDGTQRPPLRAVTVTPPGTADSDDGPVREADSAPRRPAEGTVFVPAADDGSTLNYGDVQQYISGIYRMGAKLSGDEILMDVVNVHADEAAAAWADWIQSEPKVAAFLQKMMVGTPAGKLVYVHVSMGVGYAFARAAVADIRRRAESADEPADDAAVASAA